MWSRPTGPPRRVRRSDAPRTGSCLRHSMASSPRMRGLGAIHVAHRSHEACTLGPARQRTTPGAASRSAPMPTHALPWSPTDATLAPASADHRWAERHRAGAGAVHVAASAPAAAYALSVSFRGPARKPTSMSSVSSRDPTTGLAVHPLERQLVTAVAGDERGQRLQRRPQPHISRSTSTWIPAPTPLDVDRRARRRPARRRRPRRARGLGARRRCRPVASATAAPRRTAGPGRSRRARPAASRRRGRPACAAARPRPAARTARRPSPRRSSRGGRRRASRATTSASYNDENPPGIPSARTCSRVTIP